jgi:hypothetical protein
MYTPTPVHILTLLYGEVEKTRVIECGASRKSWRLCIASDEEGVADEIVFSVQGVIVNARLVPANVNRWAIFDSYMANNAKEVRMDAKKALRLVQSIEISGVGTRTFDESMRRAELGHERFRQHFCGAAVTTWKANQSAIGQTLSASNRLFTLKSDAPMEQDTSFQDGVDPMGDLEKLKSDKLFHGQENIVRYFTRAKDPKSGWGSQPVKEQPHLDPRETSETVYDQTFPGCFQIGDIVELQASFVAIMTHQRKIKVTCRLHTVVLLDHSFTKASAVECKTQIDLMYYSGSFIYQISTERHTYGWTNNSHQTKTQHDSASTTVG